MTRRHFLTTFGVFGVFACNAGIHIITPQLMHHAAVTPVTYIDSFEYWRNGEKPTTPPSFITSNGFEYWRNGETF